MHDVIENSQPPSEVITGLTLPILLMKNCVAQEVKQCAPGNGPQTVTWDLNPDLCGPRAVPLTLKGNGDMCL